MLIREHLTIIYHDNVYALSNCMPYETPLMVQIRTIRGFTKASTAVHMLYINIMSSSFMQISTKASLTDGLLLKVLLLLPVQPIQHQNKKNAYFLIYYILFVTEISSLLRLSLASYPTLFSYSSASMLCDNIPAVLSYPHIRFGRILQ